MADSAIFIYQTRLNNLSLEAMASLDSYCALHSLVERKLHVAVRVNQLSRNELKRQFIKQYNISASMFNGIAMTLDGKIDSIKQLLPSYIDANQTAIRKKET